MYNLDDVLLGIERKSIKDETKKMEKLKKEAVVTSKTVQEPKTIVEGGGPSKKPQFLTRIKWKKKSKSVAGNLKQLKKKWLE